MGKIYAYMNNKGGILKTSCCVNLAGVLAQKEGNKILIVDCDNQGNVATSFGKNPDQYSNTIFDALVQGLEVKEAIVNVHKNIDAIFANDDMAFFELDIVNKPEFPNPFVLLKNALEKLRSEYTHIFIDSPPQMGVVAGNILTCADEIIIPFHPETYSLRSMVKTFRAIENFKETNPGLTIAGVVPTKVKQTVTHNANLQSCREFCYQMNVHVFDTVIPESIRFAEAVGRYGLPLTLTDSKDKAVQPYFNLAEEMAI